MPRAERFLVPVGTLAKERLDKFLLGALAAREGTGDEASPKAVVESTVEPGALPEGEWNELDEGESLDDGERPDNCEQGRDAPLPALSRETLKKAIRDGFCRINGQIEKSPSAKVGAGDEIEIELPDESPEIEPEDGPIHVLFEDADVLVLAKEAGLVVHPCPSCPKGTLVQRLAFQVPDIAAMGGLRPGIVHRLDKETSGLMVVVKNPGARLILSESFAERRVQKRYLALVRGVPPKEGLCREPIGRDPDHKTRMACVPVAKGGREAESEFSTLWTSPKKNASLVSIAIHTGRTHQIRVHMAHLGHPLLGDGLYGGQAAQRLASRVMLHAAELAFPHPSTGETLRFSLAPPQDFRDCLTHLATRPLPLVVTGNPGCGKSLVLELLGKSGIPVISADALVAGYYEKGGVVADWLFRRLGENALAEDGSVDRALLLKKFGASPDFRREVEELAHELVRGDIQAFFDKASERGDAFVAAEIPLYFECGWHKGAFSPRPLALGVRASLAVRHERLAQTRSWEDDKISRIESWQWAEDKKMAACDLVVENLGSRAELETQIRDELLPRLADIRRRALADLDARLMALLGEDGENAGKDADNDVKRGGRA